MTVMWENRQEFHASLTGPLNALSDSLKTSRMKGTLPCDGLHSALDQAVLKIAVISDQILGAAY